jgi:hypothetical protein
MVLLTFSPWITYAVLSSVTGWQWALIAAAVVQAVLAVRLVRHHQLDVLSVGTLVFFVAMSVVALIDPHSPIHRWIPAIAYGVLALIAGTSLAIGRPFTLSIAKRTTPEEVWARPEFIAINRFLTAVWSVSFATGCAICAVLIGVAGDRTSLIVVAVLAFVVPMRITQVTAARARARRREADSAAAR